MSAGPSVYPFSLSAIVGVCASSNRRNWILLEVTGKFIPLVVTGNAILIGLKHQLSGEQSTEFFSLKFGPVWIPDWSYHAAKVDGGCAQLDYGYDYVSDIGLGASLSLGVTAIVFRPRNPIISPVATANISWWF